MPIVAKVGASFTPAPAGTHVSVCCDVVDLGELKVSYGGKDKHQHKVRIVWQIEENKSDGKPFTVSKRYTLSLHEKSSLRKDLESWRGRAFTAQELEGFDLEVLLGAPALLNVLHTVKEGSTYANVTSIMRLPKQMQAPAIRDYVRVCDRPATEGQGAPETGYYDESAYGGISDDDVPFMRYDIPNL